MFHKEKVQEDGAHVFFLSERIFNGSHLEIRQNI